MTSDMHYFAGLFIQWWSVHSEIFNDLDFKERKRKWHIKKV